VRSHHGDRHDARDQHECPVQVGAARDLTLLARLLAVLGRGLLCAVFAGHRQATCSAVNAAPTLEESCSDIQPATKGSVTPTSASATTTLVGKPTAKTFSCGTTRETTPKATSVTSSASNTGATISSAEANTVEKDCSAPPTSDVSRGAEVSGTNWKVR